MSKFTCGADPEVFLINEKQEFISAIDKVGGTKDDPRPLFDLGDGFAVQEDNVAVEYNIPPASTMEQFVNNIKTARHYLEGEVGRMGLAFSTVSAVEFPMEQLQDVRALTFGCDPDYNAWTGKENPRPMAFSPFLRSAGGHIHVGTKFRSKKEAYRFIRCMDMSHGLPSILMDKGELRKNLYGKAGACRIKPYGVEYRTLSNFWIFSDHTIEWAWKQTAAAMDAWQKGVDVSVDVEEAINTNNKDKAIDLMKYYGVAYA